MKIDVMVPSLSKKYEFDINEDKELSVIIEEIVEAVCQKENTAIKGDIAQMLLLHKESKSILIKYQTPVSAGIKNGDTLIIV
ncbi:MAG: glutamyl-tRNA amidotransferase [Oscillospiraceae bacterium]|nr:glutamyl-tRNA amidotransferase [Oscillospiraceae bacterium]